MALTDANTVLILGAGVSVPFGLPTGVQLIDDIGSNLDEQLAIYHEHSGRYFSTNSLFPLTNAEIFLNFPYLQPLLWKIGAINSIPQISMDHQDLKNELHQQFREMKELKVLLENQTSDSIDDFIILNPNYSDHVKICIAAEFIKSLYEIQEEHRTDLVLREISKRYLPRNGKSKENDPERNWIHRLINLIRLGVSEGKVSKENKIQIITFNYDTILEHVLEQQFSNYERRKTQSSTYKDFVEITHVHGKCGELTNSLNVPGQTCWKWSKGIKVIREDESMISDDIRQAREYAKSLITNANEIYACGFAFAKANTDKIGLYEKKVKTYPRTIHYCNFSDDVGLRNAANKFEYKARNNGRLISSTVEQKNIGVADWIGIGTLGELP